MMNTLLTVIAAAGALQTSSPDMALTKVAPVAVSTCSVSQLLNPAPYAEFGPGIGYYSLALTFTNTDDVDATQVAFDVRRGGEREIITDRGHFRKGVAIEHRFDDYTGDFRRLQNVTSCTVASVTFADGRRWTAPSGADAASVTMH